MELLEAIKSLINDLLTQFYLCRFSNVQARAGKPQFFLHQAYVAFRFKVENRKWSRLANLVVSV